MESMVGFTTKLDRELTDDGGLYLLKKSEEALYTDIKIGDKLRVGHDINVRQGPTKDFPPILVLEKGACVIVTEKPKYEKEILEHAKSGGRLKVSTTACGIFR